MQGYIYRMTHSNLRGPGDWEDIVSLREEPRKRNLARGGVVLLAEGGKPVAELQDVREVLRRVAGDRATPVIRREIVRAPLDNAASGRGSEKRLCNSRICR